MMTLYDLADKYFVATVTVDEEADSLCIQGATGVIYHDVTHDKFVWTRDGVRFNPFDPDNLSHVCTAARAIGLQLKSGASRRRRAEIITNGYFRRLRRRAEREAAEQPTKQF